MELDRANTDVERFDQTALIEQVVIAVVRRLVDDQAALRRIALAELQWLTEKDLREITGYAKRTIDKWRQAGWIRLFKPGDSNEWRTTIKMWKEDERILIEAGLLDLSGLKPTISDRKRQIATLRRRRLGIPAKTGN